MAKKIGIKKLSGRTKKRKWNEREDPGLDSDKSNTHLPLCTNQRFAQLLAKGFYRNGGLNADAVRGFIEVGMSAIKCALLKQEVDHRLICTDTKLVVKDTTDTLSLDEDTAGAYNFKVARNLGGSQVFIAMTKQAEILATTDAQPS